MTPKLARGFTLIEIMIVLVIMVIGVSAITGGIASGQDTATLKATARELLSAFRYAHGQALMEHQDVTVDFNLEENTYTLSNRDKVYAISKDISLSLLTATDEVFGQGQASMRFYADGSASGGRVTLENAKGKLHINNNWLTGASELRDALDDEQ
ncbi:MAG: GspH/FimT family pseudopilin [Methylovulum sp.]|jgi:general secretion pathway protein H|nr:GspH/FimT family pseudopilin [Methylovulum sp.]